MKSRFRSPGRRWTLGTRSRTRHSCANRSRRRNVDLAQARRRQRLKVEQSGKLLGVKLDGSGFSSATHLDRVDEALRKVSKPWRRLALGDPNLTLSESRAVGRLYLTGDSGVPLLRGLLDMFSVKDEVIPVNSTPFENCHPLPLSPFALAPRKGKVPKCNSPANRGVARATERRKGFFGLTKTSRLTCGRNWHPGNQNRQEKADRTRSSCTTGNLIGENSLASRRDAGLNNPHVLIRTRLRISQVCGEDRFPCI